MNAQTLVPNTRNSSTAHQSGTSSDTSTVETITLGSETSAILVTVETTSARITLDGSDPSASSAPSMVVQKDSAPLYIPVGPGTVVKFVSTASADSVVQVCELS